MKNKRTLQLVSYSKDLRIIDVLINGIGHRYHIGDWAQVERIFHKPVFTFRDLNKIKSLALNHEKGYDDWKS